MAKDYVQTVAEGSFDVQQTHEISSPVEAMIVEYEAAANTFAINVITDDKVRQQYMRHIKELSDQVRQEVASGNISVKGRRGILQPITRQYFYRIPEIHIFCWLGCRGEVETRS